LTLPQDEEDPTLEPVCEDAIAWERQHAQQVSLADDVEPDDNSAVSDGIKVILLLR
jgi:hypothetical protein